MSGSSLHAVWRGQAPLWTVFWLYGVIASHAMFGLILLAYTHDAPWFAFAPMVLGFLAYTAWILAAVWRCAFNADEPIYGHAARGLTVAWAINAVLVCGFLLLDHLAH